jgi:single-strand DNA-binding protein
MARGLNKAILIGNLGADPDSRFTVGGLAVTVISVATSSVRKRSDGEVQERTEWHRVKLFGRLGEVAATHLRKGSQVYIEGEIRYEKFSGRDGQDRYITEILADVMQMLGEPANPRALASSRGTQSRVEPDIVPSAYPAPSDSEIDEFPF